MQNNVSFKGCIPVEFYAQHPITQKFVPIVKDQNIKKFQNFVVRNLNKTLSEKNRTDAFIHTYSEVDPDYAKVPVVRSFFDKYAPRPQSAKEPAPRCVWLFTGKDVDFMNATGKELNLAKMDIFEATGKKEGAAVNQAKRKYRKEVYNLIERICPRVHDAEGKPYVMKVFFTPEYDKNGKLKKFNYLNTFFDHDMR